MTQTRLIVTFEHEAEDATPEQLANSLRMALLTDRSQLTEAVKAGAPMGAVHVVAVDAPQ